MQFFAPEVEPVPSATRELSENIITRAVQSGNTTIDPSLASKIQESLADNGIVPPFEDFEIYINQANDRSPSKLGTSSTFHTDGYNRYSNNDTDRVIASRTLNLFSSSTPTEYVVGTLIFHSIDLNDYADRNEAEQAAIRSLTPFPDCWIDSATGIDDSSRVSEVLELQGIEAKELSIVQILPWMIAHGRAGDLLHRSARRHDSQPTTKLLARWFS